MPVEPGTVNAPEFPRHLDWLNTDRPIALKELRGKVVLLDFWTYCCINCMHVLPDLKRLEHKYRDELVVIGVHSAKFHAERDSDNIRQAILRNEIEHPVINDNQMQIWQEYATRAWPTLVLIDPKGKVIGSHSGEGIFEMFDKVIAQIIEHYDAEGALDRRPLPFLLERERQADSLLSFPGKVLADAAGGRLFIADSNHNRVVVASLADGAVLEIIGAGSAGLRDGRFEQAELHHPQGMALHGRFLYIADTENHAIRRADLDARRLETLAGTGQQSYDPDSTPGPARDRPLNSPWDLTLVHGVLFIAMAGPHQIWGLDLEGGILAGHAGSGHEGHVDGPLLAAALAQPSGLATDGQVLFIADSEISAIRTADLDPRGGHVRSIVGQGLFDFGDVDGSGDDVRLQHPLGIAYTDGTLFVADTYNNKIKSIGTETRSSVTFAGTGEAGLVDGDAEDARFDEPGGLSYAAGMLYVADTNNHAIRVIDLRTQQVSTFPLQVEQRLTAAARPRRIRLEPQTVRPGEIRLDVALDLPPNHHLNEDAPSTITVHRDGASNTVPVKAFPAQVSLAGVPGEGMLEVEASIFYCREGRDAVCLYHLATLELPLLVDPQGRDGVDVRLKVPGQGEPLRAAGVSLP
jgi:thiol-disulfide isomerase/thioredoxin/DNA-binding beta-propeller fold protein YncE